MRKSRIKQAGVSLIVSLLLLVALTILVVTGVRGTTMNERMAGNTMERARAFQAAEQAMTQGVAVLQNNSETCLTACSTTMSGVGAVATVLPATWIATSAANITLASAQKTTASYVINQLPTAYLPAGKNTCAAYSVMGRGVGLSSESVVVLQTVAFVCPL